LSPLVPAESEQGNPARDSGHNRGVLSLACFVAGGLLGWGAAQAGARTRRVWPVVLRTQILLTSSTLSLVAAWRLTSARQLLGPLALAAGLWLMLAVTLGTRGRRSAGEVSLEAWAVSPNSGFWVVPAAAALAGSSGTMIAVLANVITTGWGAVAIHLMRRDAPIPQRRATSWVDQSPVVASLVGLVLHVAGPAPSWTADVLVLAGPLLAFSGAALFTGSVVHPHNLSVPRPQHAVRRWAWLTVVRVAYYLIVGLAAALAGSTALTVVAVLSALSAPSFQPIQLAVLYGYRSEIVVAAVRWGWLLAPFGLALAALVR
jgi:predicted permease